MSEVTVVKYKQKWMVHECHQLDFSGIGLASAIKALQEFEDLTDPWLEVESGTRWGDCYAIILVEGYRKATRAEIQAHKDKTQARKKQQADADKESAQAALEIAQREFPHLFKEAV